MNQESFLRIRVLLQKEWRELRNNRGVVLPTLILPIVLTALATGSLAVISSHLNLLKDFLKHQNIHDLMVHVGRQMVTLFLVMPCVLPSTTAAHSIVGEKTARTLEPILATPVKTWELLCAKMIACMLLGVLPSWLGYGVFLGYLHDRLPPGIFPNLVAPTQLVMVLFIGPLLALLSVAVTTMISSRWNDVQAAQSVSVLVALPIIGLATSQAAGLVNLPLPVVLVVGVLLFVLDLGALRLCVWLFARETILTRWK